MRGLMDQVLVDTSSTGTVVSLPGDGGVACELLSDWREAE